MIQIVRAVQEDAQMMTDIKIRAYNNEISYSIKSSMQRIICNIADLQTL